MANVGQLIGVVSSLRIVYCAYVLPKHYDGNAVLEQIKTMRETEDFISLFQVLPFGKSLHAYGHEMAYLTATGHKMENFDMAICSIASQHKMVMETDNVNHFGHIRGLEIEDWKTEESRV